MTARRPVHQIINHLAGGDAIGHDCLAIQERLRAEGHPSEIFALHPGPGMAGRCRAVSDYKDVSSPENVVIWHFSVGTEITDLVAELPDRVVMRYHNITPAEFFSNINAQTEMECLLGRKQLARTADFVDLGIGDSAYNEAELTELGFKASGNCPIMLNLDQYRPAEPSARLTRLFGPGPLILHVGRIVPQKRYEDLIKVFYFIKKIRPEAGMLFIGGDSGMKIYRHALEDLIAELALTDIRFTNHITQKDLLACYTRADVYLCLSDHEGFCVPLVEAMKFDLPVAAKESSAVTQTLGEGGVLLKNPTPVMVAEAACALLEKDEFRSRVIQTQRRRLKDFEPDVVWRRFYGLLEPVLAG